MSKDYFGTCSKIFISYRRQDSAIYAGRLHDALAARYGSDRIILDVISIEPGVNFVEHISNAVESCELMLVLIGRDWLNASNHEGNRSLDDPDDFVRTEVAAALKLNKRVVPVLVGGAYMPSGEELPSDLATLGRRQAIELRDSKWEEDLKQLYNLLDTILVTQTSIWERFSALGERLAGVHKPKDIDRGDSNVHSSEPTPQRAPQPNLQPKRKQRLAARSRQAQSLAKKSASPPAPVASAAKHKIFVSFAEEDRDLADSVVEVLEGRGHQCWIAHRDIPGGEPSWSGAIVQAIATSNLVIVVASRHALSSKQVLREVTVADNENIPFVPFCIDDAPIPNDFRYFFSTAQRVEVKQQTRAEGIKILSAAVENQLAKSV